jgi:hypothetical protein
MYLSLNLHSYFHKILLIGLFLFFKEVLDYPILQLQPLWVVLYCL